MLQFGRKAIFVTIQMEASLGLIQPVTELTPPVEAHPVHQVPPPQHPQVGFQQHSPEIARATHKGRIFEKVLENH